MPINIFQIRIALDRSRPEIWRRVLVPSEMPLAGFHHVIQVTMGWENEHLHQFIRNGCFYTVKYKGDDFWGEMNNVDYKEQKLRICDLLEKAKEKITYEYDFGDGWLHTILLEKILPVDATVTYPVCTDGKMHCPPEDCGGVYGYASLLEILKHPEHEEYENYLEWLGEKFDPDHFSVEEVNRRLRRLRL